MNTLLIAALASLGLGTALYFYYTRRKPVDTRLKVSVVALPMTKLSFDFVFKSDKDREWRKGSVTLQTAMAYGVKTTSDMLDKCFFNSKYNGPYKESVRIEMVTDAQTIKDAIREILVQKGADAALKEMGY